MIGVKKIAHAAYEVPDLERQAEYYTEILGLTLAHKDHESVYLASTLDHHCVVLHKGSQAQCTRVGLQLGADDDLGAFEQQVRGHGLQTERRKDAARKTEAREQSERALWLRQLVEANRVREPPGEVNFHFVKRSGKIGRLAVSPETAGLLESGAAAVVEDPGQPEHAVVPSEAAQRIYQVDPQAIRFWHGPDKPIGFSDAGES